MLLQLLSVKHEAVNIKLLLESEHVLLSIYLLCTYFINYSEHKKNIFIKVEIFLIQRSKCLL